MVRLTDRPGDVHRGRKTITQQQQQHHYSIPYLFVELFSVRNSVYLRHRAITGLMRLHDFNSRFSRLPSEFQSNCPVTSMTTPSSDLKTIYIQSNLLMCSPPFREHLA